MAVIPAPMPAWARQLAGSICLIHAVTVIAGLFFGGLFLALGAFGVVMLVVGAALLYRCRDRDADVADDPTRPGA